MGTAKNTQYDWTAGGPSWFNASSQDNSAAQNLGRLLALGDPNNQYNTHQRKINLNNSNVPQTRSLGGSLGNIINNQFQSPVVKHNPIATPSSSNIALTASSIPKPGAGQVFLGYSSSTGQPVYGHSGSGRSDLTNALSSFGGNFKKLL